MCWVIFVLPCNAAKWKMFCFWLFLICKHWRMEWSLWELNNISTAWIWFRTTAIWMGVFPLIMMVIYYLLIQHRTMGRNRKSRQNRDKSGGEEKYCHLDLTMQGKIKNNYFFQQPNSLLVFTCDIFCMEWNHFKKGWWKRNEMNFISSSRLILFDQINRKRFGSFHSYLIPTSLSYLLFEF